MFKPESRFTQQKFQFKPEPEFPGAVVAAGGPNQILKFGAESKFVTVTGIMTQCSSLRPLSFSESEH